MLISVPELNSKWSVKPKGVLHVGAHEAEEWPAYKDACWIPVYWIEAQENLVVRLKNSLPADSNKVFSGVVWGESNLSLKFNISSNGQSSSLLDFGSHIQNYPKIQNIDSIQVQTIRIDEIIDGQDEIDFVNLDIQGAELEALKGMGNLINSVKWIYCEVNSEQTYVGCPHVSEIDRFLKKKGFIRICTVWVRGKGWGDALYMQKKLARRYILEKIKCDLKNYLGDIKYRLSTGK